MSRTILRGVALLLMFGLVVAATEASGFFVPEHTETRMLLRDLVTGSLSTVTASVPGEYRQRTTVHRVRFEVQESPTAVYLLFLNETRGAFPVAGRGSWVIRRDADGGAIDQIKVFLADDPDFFVRIFPVDRGALMEVTLAGHVAYRNVRIPIPFERVLVSPFADVQRATAGIVDWELFLVPTAAAEYAAVERMVGKLRVALPTLPDAEDGAMDRHGNLVFIESLVLQDQLAGFNCSGFAKWVVDGLYQPRTGTFLDIDAMKQRHVGLRGHRWSERYEDERDPYFGLDWSRNLAVALMQLDFPGRSLSPTAADVSSVRFALSVPNVGFDVADLSRTLYLLARRHPGDFYIGSLNRDFGSDPVLRQHVHIVVIFPYFDGRGRFQVAVMERNVESTVGSLVRRYRDDTIHLVRARVSDDFVAPVFRSGSPLESGHLLNNDGG